MSYTILSFILFSELILATSCCKDDDLNPVDLLPPVTTSGEKTFGCLIDGEAFLPGNGSLTNHILNCDYIWLPEYGYFFQLFATNFDYQNGIAQIVIKADSLKIDGPGKYQFYKREAAQDNPGKFTGIVDLSESGTDDIYFTYDVSGELDLIRFDEDNQIAAGTFWFNAIHTVTGDTVKIREGKFDVIFGL